MVFVVVTVSGVWPAGKRSFCLLGRRARVRAAHVEFVDQSCSDCLRDSCPLLKILFAIISECADSSF